MIVSIGMPKKTGAASVLFDDLYLQPASCRLQVSVGASQSTTAGASAGAFIDVISDCRATPELIWNLGDGRTKPGVTGADSLQYSEPGTYVWTVTATAGDTAGRASGSITVMADPNAPVISMFEAKPATIAAGQSSTLSWATTNATSVSIDQGLGAVSTTGSLVVSPQRTTTYTLTATKDSSLSTTRPITVTVAPPESPRRQAVGH